MVGGVLRDRPRDGLHTAGQLTRVPVPPGHLGGLRRSPEAAGPEVAAAHEPEGRGAGGVVRAPVCGCVEAQGQVREAPRRCGSEVPGARCGDGRPCGADGGCGAGVPGAAGDAPRQARGGRDDANAHRLRAPGRGGRQHLRRRMPADLRADAQPRHQGAAGAAEGERGLFGDVPAWRGGLLSNRDRVLRQGGRGGQPCVGEEGAGALSPQGGARGGDRLEAYRPL
mmetsp:Transcript_122160/g.341928  ORF Transcript_122160/g.341928 Transcript_122160/m.341928 type:complete len:225 (+) Transcript_122160:1-675(+)